MYSFRNRFRLRETERLDADVLEIRLSGGADAEVVTLENAERERRVSERDALVSTADELVIKGSGYVHADAAATAGRRWRQRLTIALAREGKGVDFGPDDRTTPVADITYDYRPPALLQEIGVVIGDRVIIDDYMLLVFPTTPVPKFVNFVMGTPTVKISGWIDRFENRLLDARDSGDKPWTKRKVLAYRLVHLALIDTNPETKHIQLVTAVEVLLEPQNRPQPVLDALDVLLSEVDSSIDPGVARRVSEILRGNKEESIVRAGREQINAQLDKSYAGKNAGDFFKDVYDMRSRLVHRVRRGSRRPSADQVRSNHAELLRFVLDLLEKGDFD